MRRVLRATGRRSTAARIGVTFGAGTLLFAACGDGGQGGISTRPASSSTVEPAYQRLGSLPERAEAGERHLDVRRCEVTPAGRLVLDATFTNTAPFPVFVGEVRIELPDHDSDSRAPMSIGLVVGPGRRLQIEGDEEVDAAAGPCEEIDIEEDAERDPDGAPIPPDAVSISGCDAESYIEVNNPTDELVGIAVTVEFFDPDGLSEGRYTYREWPVSENGAPAAGGLPAGAVGTLDVNMAREVAGCEIVGAVYTVDPKPEVVASD